MRAPHFPHLLLASRAYWFVWISVGFFLFDFKFWEP